MADQMQIYKYCIHQVAHAYGKTATFMPKPIYGDNGSGMHVHQSIWKDGKPLFAGNKYADLSEMCLYYIGGIIKHAKAINAFTNPSTNSYKRLVPGFEAPVLLAYSARNRSASCRIPFTSSPKAKRVEVRFPDPTANPYLAFAAMLMAGLDGIKNKIHPGDADGQGPLRPAAEELKKIPTVCGSLREALQSLDKDRAFLKAGGVFDDDQIDAYIELKMDRGHPLRAHPAPGRVRHVLLGLVEAEIASLPFSIDWLPDGRLLIVNARNNRLLRREADGSFVTHVDLAPLSPLGCNEIVVDGVGNAYVNNVNFDMPGGPVEGYMRYLEEPFAPGFIALVTPDGTARQVADGLAFPNGMAITPDNRTLIVAESYSGALTAFDIEADGSLTNRRLWAQLQRQGADGICIDAQGAVWASSGAGCLRVREGGAILDEITVEDGLMCFACMLGGADGNTLFIVANAWTGEIATSESQPTGKVLTARVGVRHAGFPSS
jgi:sugar lactone lactonase YvrE